MLLLYVILLVYLLTKAINYMVTPKIEEVANDCPPHKWHLQQIHKDIQDDTYYMVCKKCKKRPGIFY